MRVLHVTPHLLVGGAERLVLELASRQASQPGSAVGVAAAPGALVRQLDGRISFYRLPGSSGRVTAPPRWQKLIALPTWRRAFKQTLQDFRPDVVHTHALEVTVPHWDILRRFPVVMTVHSLKPAK